MQFVLKDEDKENLVFVVEDTQTHMCEPAGWPQLVDRPSVCSACPKKQPKRHVIQKHEHRFWGRKQKVKQVYFYKLVKKNGLFILSYTARPKTCWAFRCSFEVALFNRNNEEERMRSIT